MKVLMIGDSEAGKTTYMAAMYKVMADGQNYHVVTQRSSDRQTLKRLAAGLERGEYPARTETRSSYDFTFRFEYKGETVDFFDFEWIDYRGGAIHQKTDDPVAADLSSYLRNATALIVFLDYTKLNTREIKRQWRRLKQFVMNFAARAGESENLALTIMLTKCDIDAGYSFDESETGKEIMSFIKTFANNRNLFGMLAFSGINRELTGNVFFPFIHSMRFGMIHEYQRQVRKYNERSIFGDIATIFIGDPIKERFQMIETFLGGMDEMLQEHNGEEGYFLF